MIQHENAIKHFKKIILNELSENNIKSLLENPYFQLYDIDTSASITCYGRELIQSTIEGLGHYFNND